MTIEGLNRIPAPVRDPEESWRRVRLVSSVVPAVTLLLLGIGLLMHPQTRQWSEVRISVVFLGAVGLSTVLAGPVFVRATMISALDAFAKRYPPASDGTVAAAIAPLLIAQVAACELPALLGFVAYALGAPLAVFLVFVAVSFVGYAYFFPRRAQWDGWLARARPSGNGSGVRHI